MKTYKGFNKDLKCRDFQYEIGKEYETDKAKCCETGFHACEYPLDCLDYYAPTTSRYCEVEQSGQIDKDDDDTKISSTKIKIGAEISLLELIKASIKYIKERATKKCKGSCLKSDNSVASNSGDSSVASNSGYMSVAEVSNNESIACAFGIKSKAKGKIGCWLVISEWKYINHFWHRIDTQCVKVDGKIIKEDTYYTLKNGKFVEVNND